VHYVRTREKEEVDFLITRDEEPLVLFEVKTSDDRPSKALLKIQAMLGCTAYSATLKPSGR